MEQDNLYKEASKRIERIQYVVDARELDDGSIILNTDAGELRLTLLEFDLVSILLRDVYDEGYWDGESEGRSEGEATGYDEGYQQAMDECEDR